MPPDGYTSVSLPDPVIAKLSRLIAADEASSYREAVEVAVDGYLGREPEQLSDAEIAQLLADRLSE